MTKRKIMDEKMEVDENQTSAKCLLPLPDSILQPRLELIRKWVARPIPIRDHNWTDPQPCLVEGGCVLIGNKYHAADVDNLLSLGVTAVLNCASGGISRLPVDRLKDSGIRYAFTNCKRDDYDYPLLHDRDSMCSQHLVVAKALYADVLKEGGKVLFFCVAGQNRSAALAIAVMMLFGHQLEPCLQCCSKHRPFVLENIGFQKQLVELESMLAVPGCQKIKLDSSSGGGEIFFRGTPPPRKQLARTRSVVEREAKLVEIELLIPGLCTMEVKIPRESTIPEVKKVLVDRANHDLLAYSDSQATVAYSWVVLAMFGYDDMYDIPLETEAISRATQLDRISTMFNLKVARDDYSSDPRVCWTERCRFALVILSVRTKRDDGFVVEEPWKFVHEERAGAPATLLQNNLMSTRLRAWDFVTGQAYCSKQPVVFSFADDSRDTRAFMKISHSANEAQQFLAPGEGDILGMGANAIVHRVQLGPTSSGTSDAEDEIDVELSEQDGWDAAVKRPFSLSKMLRSLETSSEAGLAKRMRFVSTLNSDGRVLSFYGLGVGLAANAHNENEYKFEISLLAEYEEEFSTYTMRSFMEDYVAVLQRVDKPEKRAGIQSLQANFSLISVKVLLCSLLNAFRDLTLMGVMAFDFNHLSNVLVSRDHRTVRLIDIDGDSRGSIQFPSEYISGAPSGDEDVPVAPHKPSLDVDLNTVLPTVVEKLILGKGRGPSFVGNTRSKIWHAKPEDAKEIVKTIIRENFFSNNSHGSAENLKRTDNIINKVAEWFFSVLKKIPPWDNWTVRKKSSEREALRNQL